MADGVRGAQIRAARERLEAWVDNVHGAPKTEVARTYAAVVLAENVSLRAALERAEQLIEMHAAIEVELSNGPNGLNDLQARAVRAEQERDRLRRILERSRPSHIVGRRDSSTPKLANGHVADCPGCEWDAVLGAALSVEADQ